MNSKLIGIVIVVIVLIALGGFWLMKMQSSDDLSGQDEINSTDDSDSTGTESTSSSLKNLLTLGRSQQCSFGENEASSAEGVVYVGNNKARGDFISHNNGQQIASHMIVDGETSYVWMDGTATGFKTTINDSQPTGSATADQQFDANANVDYHCESWVVDATMFIPPSNVQFSDTSALFPGTSGQAVTNSGSADAAKAAQCAACNSAPPEARSQCLAALGCN